MRIGQLIFHLPAQKKQKIRRMEKINKKIASVKSSLVFNRTCLYIYIYIYIYTGCPRKKGYPTFRGCHSKTIKLTKN